MRTKLGRYDRGETAGIAYEVQEHPHGDRVVVVKDGGEEIFRTVFWAGVGPTFGCSTGAPEWFRGEEGVDIRGFPQLAYKTGAWLGRTSGELMSPAVGSMVTVDEEGQR